ncbi:hypothetical protein Dred_0973 [Desulforamulus reducens MI-1]|uniref:Uncharacterized protein n=1 Tax=Desulforamulus reducens (strain ATCC BAA-1160 / DSM 100696 / MI-1) TaxID=349161 RepID=A4J355_DESRM|nr:hypothetical protein [Desulforamulus reducens]ABO49508.1 hypothetical protein Dred_0973 [Desulforamulus reducens MI-1]
MADNIFHGVSEERFIKRERRPRRELDMPQLRFHHMDTWVPVLGLEVFAAWLKMYTLCDRKTYPKDNVVQHKPLLKMAVEFGCGKDKALAILKKLFEYGLIDIIQARNSKGGVKNHYYWYDIPIYANTTYCELKKCRSWDETAWEGKQLIEIRLAKQEQQKKLAEEQTEEIPLTLEEKNQSKNQIGYQSEKPIGNQSKNQIGSEEYPIGKSDWEPIGKSAYSNNINISIDKEDKKKEEEGVKSEFEELEINYQKSLEKLDAEYFEARRKVFGSEDEELALNILENDYSSLRSKFDYEYQQAKKEIIINQQLSELDSGTREAVKLFYETVDEDPEIIPFIQKWVKETSTETVIYCINRMLEQDDIGNVIMWLDKAVQNPEKYPKKIEYSKSIKKISSLRRSMYS